MAITQISQITVRKGLQENLPQLAGGEFGWAIDSGNLYIGNGTLQEGAPALGVTQIITQNSPILQAGTSFTFDNNYAAGYTTPLAVTRSINQKLSDIVSVKDFGAVGDGVADDVVAIRNALSAVYEYTGYPSTTVPATRKALYFPAGVYNISGTISIPSYCTIYGEGLDHSIIRIQAPTGANISLTDIINSTVLANVVNSSNIANPALVSTGITVQDITFQGGSNANAVVELGYANDIRFDNVRFAGTSRSAANATIANASCVTTGLPSANTISCTNIIFRDCEFSGASVGLRNQGNTITSAISVAGSLFAGLNRGVDFQQGANSANAISSVQFNNNLFENIYYEAIRIAQGSLVSSTNDIFLNCANQNLSPGGSPSNIIVDVNVAGFTSASDLFDRADISTYPRYRVNNQAAIVTDNTKSINLGLRNLGINQVTSLSSPGGTVVDLTANFGTASSYNVNYVANNAGGNYRSGKLDIITNGSSVIYNDDYNETSVVSNLVLTPTYSSGNLVLNWSSNATVTFNYSVDAIQNNN